MTDDTPREDPPFVVRMAGRELITGDDIFDTINNVIEPQPKLRRIMPQPADDIPPQVELPRLVDALNDDVYSKIRARLAYLEDWRTRQQHENGKLLGRLDSAEAKVREYEAALGWETTCLSCSRVLTFSYEETARAEKAEAELATIRRVAAEVLDTGHDRDMGHLMEALAEAGVNLAALDGDTPKEQA